MNKQSPRSEFGVSRRQLITALRKLRRGDFTVRLPEDGRDDDSEIAVLFNEVVGLNQQITERIRAPVEGRRQGRQDRPARQGARRHRRLGNASCARSTS